VCVCVCVCVSRQVAQEEEAFFRTRAARGLARPTSVTATGPRPTPTPNLRALTRESFFANRSRRATRGSEKFPRARTPTLATRATVRPRDPRVFFFFPRRPDRTRPTTRTKRLGAHSADARFAASERSSPTGEAALRAKQPYGRRRRQKLELRAVGGAGRGTRERHARACPVSSFSGHDA
jgi:hypothetical protein